MRTKSKKTVFVHPNGYFEVVEVSGVNLMGDPFHYCKAIYTPNRDKRGIAHEEEYAVQKTMPHFHRMTCEERESIRTMFLGGMKTVEIAQKTGRSTQAIRDATKDLREPKNVRFWSEDDKKKAREMWFDGYSLRRIGRELDRNPSSVRDMLQREWKPSGQ